MSLTKHELKCLEITKDLHNNFIMLSPDAEDGGHPDDIKDFVHHLHAIQNIIFARPGLRDYRKNKNEKNNV